MRPDDLDRVAHEITTAGAEGVFIRTDVSKPDEVEALIAKAVKTYGRIDCAFNNAATEGKMIVDGGLTAWAR